MILLVDNYDSFSYNLYQQIGTQLLKMGSNEDIRVVRNDDFSAQKLVAMNPSHIVLSPGPGRPEGAGVCIELIQWAAARIPILGVCLGHQAICEAFGATVSYAKELMHGKVSTVEVDTSIKIFDGLPARFEVGRYHSLAVLEETVPDTIRVCARTEDDEVMAAAHRDYAIYGVQFHPESILTPLGGSIMKNFLGVV
jgi:anthranilate synthase component 2